MEQGKTREAGTIAVRIGAVLAELRAPQLQHKCAHLTPQGYVQRWLQLEQQHPKRDGEGGAGNRHPGYMTRLQVGLSIMH